MEEISLCDFKTYYIATVIKTVVSVENNGTEQRTKKDSHKYAQEIFDKDAKSI